MNAIPIDRDPNLVTGAEYAAATEEERHQFHARLHSQHLLYHVCLRCGFLVAYGGQTCEACPYIEVKG